MLTFIRNHKNKSFWQWFTAASERYMHLEEDQERLFDELSRRLHAIDRNLAFEFSPPQKDGREFIISCDGIAASIESVTSLVEAAPQLPGWKILAFRQRHDIEKIVIDDLTLLVADIRYTYSFNEHNRVDITLYIPGYTEEKRQQYGIGLFIILDHLLGEYDVMTKVGLIDFEPADPEQQKGTSPLDKLPELIDSRRGNEV